MSRSIRTLWTLAFLILAAVLTAVTAVGATTTTPQSTTTLNLEISEQQLSRWSFEADLQAHSVEGPASPWLGIAMAYRLFTPFSVGLRGFLPLSHTVDDATYAIQGFGRLRMIHHKSTDVFSEIEAAENFYDFIPFTSCGLAIGTLTKITPNLSVGVSGGIELATVVIDSLGLEDEPGYVVYPKIGLIANFNL